MLIQTNNVEDPIFDSDELAERLSIGGFSIEGFIEWFQFYDSLQAAGVNVDDEDGVDIDGDEIPILVLVQPPTLAHVDSRISEFELVEY